MDASRKTNWSDLALRVVSALVMAALALGANWIGGVVFALFWFLAAAAVLAEWLTLVGAGARQGVAQQFALGLGVAALAASCWLAQAQHEMAALLAILAGAVCVGAISVWSGWPNSVLAMAGVPYAAAVAVPVILLRRDETYGLTSILVLFAIVWGSDIMAYFTGRTLGGPKLWPSISPKKTWSGFIGGVVFGALGAGFVAGSFTLVLVGALLSAVSQGGDLLESALKRRFHAKDASQLIPGHGGVMDRLDGFVAAALAALLIGLAHGGMQPAQGFMIW